MNDDPAALTDPERLVSSWERLLATIGPPPEPDRRTIDDPTRASLPVTVLSGFLGAGKTTLLCALLSETDRQILAIVNDLAAIDVDARLVRARNAEAIELANGCACCQRGDDLVRTLQEITARPSLPDAIIIEASGAADPTGIALAVGHAPGVVLDGIVTVVDASSAETRLQDPRTAPLFVRQLDAAHLIASNRDGDERTLERLADAAPGKPIVAIHAESERLSTWLLGAAGRGVSLAEPGTPHRPEAFATLARTWTGVVAEDALFALLDAIPSDVLRIKGFVRVCSSLRDNWGTVESTRDLEIQCVGARWRAAPAAMPLQAASLVVIGFSGSSGLARFAAAIDGLANAALPA